MELALNEWMCCGRCCVLCLKGQVFVVFMLRLGLVGFIRISISVISRFIVNV